MNIRRVAIRAGTAAAAAALAATMTGTAYAGTEHSIQTAPSPSTGQPIEGGGSWIVNVPSGYYLGRAVVGSTFDDEVTTPNNWHFGRAIDTVNMCGYVMPGSMGGTVGSVGDTCSDATKQNIRQRLTIGKDFNAAASAAQTGSPVTSTACTFYQNYFYGSDFSSNGGHWANAAGTLQTSGVLYRFTTRDGGAEVVRDPVLGWGFVPYGCTGFPSPLYNDPDNV